jgi:1-acyl-sn-glycerol-3-phosphate acyltransferase
MNDSPVSISAAPTAEPLPHSRLGSALRLFVGFLVVAGGATFTMLILAFLLPFRVARIKVCNFYGKTIGYLTARIAGVTPVVRHRERLDQSAPAIYMANHTSTVDAFLSIWLCPYGGCGVMKKEVLRIPFFGQLYLLSGHLWIDRANKGSAIAALSGVAELVKRRNLSIWIMPEGTRSRDGRLQPFKLGFVHLAIATGLPIVPVIYHGAHKTWVKGSTALRPTRVEIDILEPIDTRGWTAETAREHAAAVHDVFARALRPEQQPLAGAPAVKPERGEKLEEAA